ncbi:hypothetical protein [Thalassomonas haliotis]|uniref:Uncharacterized protein n=1 Tax=Thalassomonas haliotis TaxID=485448 RepID=A0ABY7VCN5_9GAMM|nr:hypothetical protein [Thalassomonas haliotis]WDE11051.1 hypothetical protein H3N35_22885 [Thalassomonas haliotis]
MKKWTLPLLTILLNTHAFAEKKAIEIENYQINPIDIFDADGNPLKEVNTKTLPKPNVTVLASNDELGIVKILDLQGKEIWLDTLDLKMNIGKTVSLPCVKLAMNLPEDNTRTGTSGFGSACKKGS